MPHEVFDQCIAPNLEAYGWPFPSANCSVVGTPWQDFFSGHSLQQWADFDWRLLSFPFRQDLFHPDTIWRVDGIIGFCVDGRQTEMANLQDTTDRFRASASFIQKHGSLPAPIVAIAKLGCLELVDGHHRIAALVHVGFPTGFQIPIWVATSHAI